MRIYTFQFTFRNGGTVVVLDNDAEHADQQARQHMIDNPPPDTAFPFSAFESLRLTDIEEVTSPTVISYDNGDWD